MNNKAERHQTFIRLHYAYLQTQLTEEALDYVYFGRLNREVDQVYPGYSDDVLSKGISAVGLRDIHFTKGTLYELKPVANQAYLITFGLVGLIILLIILTNYTNLSIAMYADRQKELGGHTSRRGGLLAGGGAGDPASPPGRE